LFVLKRILVPTNLGEPSKAAIQYGVAFARQFNAQLFLAHVLTEQRFDAVIETERVMAALMPGVTGAGQSAAPDSDDIVKNAAREDLGRLLTPQEAQDTRAQYVLRAAGPAGPGDEIVACATELEVELIVMGKHRLGFVEQLLAGSVTEKVIRQAPCPVLIVQHPEHEFVVPDESA
jgi:nucleotide-binding universal stress UspA family protein